VFTIALPPLRERGEDLPMLVHHYVNRCNRELGRDIREVSPEAMALLAAYSWPGNVRELQSVLKQSLLQASGTVLVPAFLPESLTHSKANRATPKREVDGEIDFDAFIRQQIACTGRADSRPALAAIACPTLVLTGDEDNVIPNSLSVEMADAIPGAKLTVIARCGHLPQPEQPQATMDALVEWLRF